MREVATSSEGNRMIQKGDCIRQTTFIQTLNRLGKSREKIEEHDDKENKKENEPASTFQLYITAA